MATLVSRAVKAIPPAASPLIHPRRNPSDTSASALLMERLSPPINHHGQRWRFGQASSRLKMKTTKTNPPSALAASILPDRSTS